MNMHKTATTALVRVGVVVERSWKPDAWVVRAEARTGSDVVGSVAGVFDAAYWSAQAVESVVSVLQAAMEAAYEH